jgi:aminopeptidase N
VDQTQAPAQTPAPIRLADYTPFPYRLDSVDLTFDLEPAATRVHGVLKFTAAHDRAKGIKPLVLDGERMVLHGIAMDGAPLSPESYVLTDHTLTIALPPASFTLAMEVGINPEANKALEGLYVSRGMFCTQCEAEGFRRIMYFPDRPDVMTVFRTTIRAPKATCPVLLSNGNLESVADLPDGRHCAVWHDPFPKPSYLFALVAGDLASVKDTFTTMSGRKVDLGIYVEHGKAPRAAYAMEALKRAMQWDEIAFGREYDLGIFNIVAVSDFNMGAMENKGLNIFNDRYILADSDTATDMDYYLIESIIGHEYFHNWSGDRVTCRDWFQLSLKEGLTVFRDQEFSADVRSAATKRIDDADGLRNVQFREDAGPLAHPVRPESYIEINNFYTSTVYQKGAEVIRMMKTLLGPDKFRAGMDLYFSRHDGQAVTCEDFVAAMEDASGLDLEQFFLWYRQAGTPVIDVDGTYDAKAQTYTMKVRQACPPTPGQPDKAPMHIPFAVGLIRPQGDDLVLKDDNGKDNTTVVLQLRKPEETFTFKDIFAEPLPSVNRGFSAPVIVRTKHQGVVLTDRNRAFLMAHDSDTFNRWDAKQDYAGAVILRATAALQEGRTPPTDEDFLAAMGAVIADRELDPAFKATLMALPGDDYVASRMDVEDPPTLYRARRGLQRAVAQRFEKELRDLYDSLRDNMPYQPDAAGTGRRALKSCALAYLATLETAASTQMVKAAFEQADNMTDRMAALTFLGSIAGQARDEALASFYEKYRHDHLVANKWLTVQAASPLPGTLAKVRALLDHEAFDLKNPNKVRAVIGTFANANAVNFHAADGSGYDFLAEQIKAIDSFNPQTAARLVAPLTRWRRFDAARQTRMRAALDGIIAKPGLSKDVQELAAKSLAP